MPAEIEFLDASEPVAGEDELTRSPPDRRWGWLLVAVASVALVVRAIVAADRPAGSVRAAPHRGVGSPALISVAAPTPSVPVEVPFPEVTITSGPTCERMHCVRTPFVPFDVVEAVFAVFPHVELGARYSVLSVDRELLFRHLVGKVGRARLTIDVRPWTPTAGGGYRLTVAPDRVTAVVERGVYRVTVQVGSGDVAGARVLRLAQDTRLCGTV